MANGRNPGNARNRDTGRDSGGFVALPWSVMDSDAWKNCSHAAKALLMEVARQYHNNLNDNGRMLLSRAYLATRGWVSAAVIQKAKEELLDAGLIFQTVKGHRPNKASWYAVTWRALDRIPGYDIGIEQHFQRGAYRLTQKKGGRAQPQRLKDAQKSNRKNAVLIPVHGTERASIVPPHGTERPPPVPPHGTIRAVSPLSSVPPHGNPLEVPSTGVDLLRMDGALPRSDGHTEKRAGAFPGNQTYGEPKCLL